VELGLRVSAGFSRANNVIADLHRGDGKRFVAHADDRLTAFLELERITHELALSALLVMTVIEISLHKWGWRVFECPGVEPVFPQKDQAIDHAQCRVCFRFGEIRILDSNGAVERVIPFDQTERRL
jgi:hypothetical protein